MYFINPIDRGNLQTLPLQTWALIGEHKKRTSSKGTRKHRLKSDERKVANMDFQ